MNIKDIAALCGLSKSTVSRYLNGGSVSKQAAAKIAQAIQETGFTANVFANRLKTNRSKLIGVLVDGIYSPSVSRMIMGINNSCRKLGYQQFLMIDEYDQENKVASMRSLLGQGVDGILFGAARLTDEHRSFLRSVDKPVMVLGQRDDEFPFCKVDDQEGGRLLGEHVAAQRLNSVVFLAGPAYDNALYQERRLSFIEACAKQNVAVTTIEAGYHEEQGYTVAVDALAFHPDMIVCASDRMSMGVMRYLGEHGIHIPDDIGLASFGNHPFGALPTISLTSVDFDYEAQGEDSATRIISLIEGKHVDHEAVGYAPRLIVRSSSVLRGAPRRSSH